MSEASAWDRETRRSFFGTTAAAVAAGWSASRTRPAHCANAPGPGDTVGLGLIGCGIRGSQLLQEFLEQPAGRVVAVCDLHQGRLEQVRHQAGGSQVQTYHDYRELLADKNVDAVIVATNGHWHVLPVIHACQAGKDAYVEKPLATSIGEGRAAVSAARKYDRIVQIGTQQRSWEHYARAVEVIRSGRLGRISQVRVWDYENQSPGFGSPPDGPPPAELDWDFWLGPTAARPFNPNYFTNHYWFFDFGGGWQVDWAVHHYDIVHWAMDVRWPVSAVAHGGKFAFDDNRQWPDTFSGALEYPPGPVADRGFLLTYEFRAGCRSERRSHAKMFCGTEGSMLLDRSGYTIISEMRGDKKAIDEESFRGQGPKHAEVFLKNVRDRARPLADVEQGHWSSNPGHLLNIAWKVGRQIHWDGQNEKVTDDPQADQLVHRVYRSPWTLDV